MWGNSGDQCERNCQCSGLITDSFKINSGGNATKRKHEEAVAQNFKFKIRPLSLKYDKPISPVERRILGEHSLTHKAISPVQRRVLGDISNSPKHANRRILGDLSPLATAFRSPLTTKSNYKSRNIDISNSPLATALKHSPQIERTLSNITLSTPTNNCNKINKIFQERNMFKRNKENIPLDGEQFMCLNDNQDLDVASPKKNAMSQWTLAKVSHTPVFATPSKIEESSRDSGYSNSAKKLFMEQPMDFNNHTFTEAMASNFSDDLVPEPGIEENFDSLHDLETELQSDNFDQCSKYEIISTDSPNIISKSSTKIIAKNFTFGAPIADFETSTSFNKPLNRILNFDDSPLRSKSTKIFKKKSLNFSETTCMSTQSIESGFVSELDDFLDEEQSSSPKINNFKSLLSGEIKQDFKRSISFNPQTKTKDFGTIFESPGEKRQLNDNSDLFQSKRAKMSPKRVAYKRAFSENAVTIMSALSRSSTEPDLIGDFSQPFALPLIAGRHGDLKSISCHTLAELLNGNYSHSIDEFQVIDCRYPYEFAGGHIQGARNLYQPSQILELMEEQTTSRRGVLIFHCEFSQERGPKLTRYLRASDRAKNQEHYPTLNFPEIYLLDMGYENFQSVYPGLCSPGGYVRMLDPKYRKELKDFRNKSEGNKKKLW